MKQFTDNEKTSFPAPLTFEQAINRDNARKGYTDNLKGVSEEKHAFFEFVGRLARTNPAVGL